MTFPCCKKWLEIIVWLIFQFVFQLPFQGKSFLLHFCSLWGQAVLPAALIARKPREGAKFHRSWVISGLNRGPVLRQIIPMEKSLPSHQGWRNTKKVVAPGVLSFYSNNTTFIPKAMEQQTGWPLRYSWTGLNILNQNCDGKINNDDKHNCRLS